MISLPSGTIAWLWGQYLWLAAYRVLTSVGLFLGSKNPTKVGTLYAVIQGTDLIVMSADENQEKEFR